MKRKEVGFWKDGIFYRRFELKADNDAANFNGDGYKDRRGNDMSLNQAHLEYVSAQNEREKAVLAPEKDSVRIDRARARVDKAGKDLEEQLKANADYVEKAWHTPEMKLIRATSVQRFVAAAMTKTPVQGAEAELLQEMKLEPVTKFGYAMPWSALAPRGGQSIIEHAAQVNGDLELAADSNTSLPVGEFRTALDMAVSPVFGMSDTLQLGIPMRLVPPGELRVPIITSPPTPAPTAKSAAVDAHEMTITTVKFNPKPLPARVRYSIIEHYTWGDRILEESLRAVLRESISDALDAQAITGSASGQNIRGIYECFKGTGLPSNPSAETTLADYASAVAGEVDGKFCSDERDMRLLIGTATWGHARSKYASNTAVDAIEKLQAMGVRVFASSRVAAVASKRQDAILCLSEIAAASSYWIGLWEGAYLTVDDPFSDSNSGDIGVTMTAIFDGGPVRGPSDRATNSDLPGMKRLRFQVQA